MMFCVHMLLLWPVQFIYFVELFYETFINYLLIYGILHAFHLPMSHFMNLNVPK